MSVQIETYPVIVYNDAEKWPVPLSLVVEHGGKQWLKISPINYGLIRTICYDLEVPRNASLKVCGEIENLKKMRNDAAQQAEQTAADELFQADGQPVKKKKKIGQQKDVVILRISGQEVQCLAPKLRQSEDLCILLAGKDLEAVFHAIRQDVPWPEKNDCNEITDNILGGAKSSSSPS
jgi:hypothetical protein